MSSSMFELIKNNFMKFITLWLVIFVAIFIILSILGLVPEEEMKETVNNEEVITLSDLEAKLASISPSLPKKVVINRVNIEVDILNPESTDIKVLDNALESGAVRYPNSGLLGEKTNILLFGHSSHLPVVRNSNYKAFNNLEKLKVGDKVSLFSDTHEFIYTVNDVSEADAENALVVFESNKREITLSTCNNFGDLSDRFVVKADLVDIREI